MWVQKDVNDKIFCHTKFLQYVPECYLNLYSFQISYHIIGTNRVPISFSLNK